MVRLAACLFLLSICLPAQANDLETIAGQLSQDRAIRADMQVAQTLKVLSKPIKSSGQILVDSELGVIWHIASPYQSTTLYPTTVTGDESASTLLVARFVSEIISTVMAGRFEELKGFLGIDSTMLSGNGQFTIRMLPTNEMMAGSIESLTIEGQRFVEKVTLVTGNGDTTVYEFSRHTAVDPGKTLPDYLPLGP